MPTKHNVNLVGSLCLILLVTISFTEQLSTTNKNTVLRPRRMLFIQDSIVNSGNGTTASDDQMKHNEIEDRITLPEPYKSIIQTSARFALAQSKVTKHVNLDTAMNFLNDISYFLAKPPVIAKVIKVVVVALATLMTSSLFFPGALKFLSAAWADPVNTLNLDKYMANGMSERSVLSVLGSKTEETLGRVGLQDNSCRERSLCYMGEILKCSFPYTAEQVTKFASDNFSNTAVRDNVYARAFVSGFVDRNCTKIGTTNSQEASSCLSSFFHSIFNGGPSDGGNNQEEARSGTTNKS